MGMLSYMASLYPADVETPGKTMPEPCSQVVLSGAASAFSRERTATLAPSLARHVKLLRRPACASSMG
jgi:hypothetical protein